MNDVRRGVVLGLLAGCTGITIALHADGGPAASSAGALPATVQSASQSDGHTSVAAEPPADEVITVIEKRVQSLLDRRRVYRDVAEGKRLYARNQYDEALPLLLDTAQRGFKGAQARVGSIYLNGLGETEADVVQGVGWIGAAAHGDTSPDIRNYFNDIWSRLPDNHVPYFVEVVEDYRERYGSAATGVVCELERQLGSYVKELNCVIEGQFPDELELLLGDLKHAEEARVVEEILAIIRQTGGNLDDCLDLGLGTGIVSC